jgi:hypothetical protein
MVIHRDDRVALFLPFRIWIWIWKQVPIRPRHRAFSCCWAIGLRRRSVAAGGDGDPSAQRQASLVGAHFCSKGNVAGTNPTRDQYPRSWSSSCPSHACTAVVHAARPQAIHRPTQSARSAEGLPAAAGAVGVGVVDAEPGVLKAILKVQGRPDEQVGAGRVDDDFGPRRSPISRHRRPGLSRRTSRS